MRKYVIIAILLIHIPFYSYSQETILPKTEHIFDVNIGSDSLEVQYISTEEGLFSPGGVFVDPQGGIFFIQNQRSKPILRYFDDKLIALPHPENLPDTWYGPSHFGVSQNGVSFSGTFFFSLSEGNIYKQTDFYSSKFLSPGFGNGYPTEWGAFFVSERPKQLISAEFKVGEDPVIRSKDETIIWLKTQKDIYSIDESFQIYKDGLLYSAIQPKDSPAIYYFGKLASGHIVWADDYTQAPKTIVIATPVGKTECIIDMSMIKYYDWGIGPWGEMYCLVLPQTISKIIQGTGKLVCIRNYLLNFGILNANNVRLRDKPSTTGIIIDKFNKGSGFYIIGKSKDKDIINGISNYWYHVRMLNGIEGWIFGEFVQNLFDGPNKRTPPWPNK